VDEEVKAGATGMTWNFDMTKTIAGTWAAWAVFFVLMHVQTPASGTDLACVTWSSEPSTAAGSSKLQ
jgi:hypothetical protein